MVAELVSRRARRFPAPSNRGRSSLSARSPHGDVREHRRTGAESRRTCTPCRGVRFSTARRPEGPRRELVPQRVGCGPDGFCMKLDRASTSPDRLLPDDRCRSPTCAFERLLPCGRSCVTPEPAGLAPYRAPRTPLAGWCAGRFYPGGRTLSANPLPSACFAGSPRGATFPRACRVRHDWIEGHCVVTHLRRLRHWRFR